VAYIDQTIKRLDAVDASDSKLQTCIEPTVVASLKRLSAGAPADIRNQLVAQLRCNNVLNHTATKEEFRAALLACQAIMSHTAGEKPAPCGPEPTENELKTLTGVLGRLWVIDEPHRLVEGQDYSLNPQSRASHERLGDEVRSFGEGDMAQGPLFSHVNEKKMFGAPCTKAFFDLMDNYEVGDDRAEEVSEKEQQEIDIFMHDLMQTPHMRYVHKVLQSWVNVDADEHVFSAEVFNAWFTNYATHSHGPKSSSGFEHVFLGEVNRHDGTVSGVHNWHKFYTAEKKGRINYKGYVGAHEASDSRLVKVRFDLVAAHAEKNVSTFFVGTSIAFQFALLTLAFFGYSGECKQGGLYVENVGPFRITTYPWHTPVGTCVRSAYIEA